jgi:hypothetical protein
MLDKLADQGQVPDENEDKKTPGWLRSFHKAAV